MTEHSLEIYKIILNRDVTFQTLVNKKWKRDDENDLDESAAFERLCTKFIEGLVGNGVWESTNHKKKGLAVMSVDPNVNPLNEILVIHGNDCIIEGYIDGGRYDVKRKMATYTDVQHKEEIPKDKIFDVMREINRARVTRPMKRGEAVLPNVLGLGVDIIITSGLLEEKTEKENDHEQ